MSGPRFCTRWCISAPAALVLASACNAAPTAPTVRIDPESPTTTVAITMVIVNEAVDPNDDPVTYGIEWLKDGEVVPELTDEDTVPAVSTEKGQEWTVRVSALDREGLEDPATATASVTIGNTRPTLDTLTLTPARPQTLDTLTVEASGSDTDGEGVVLNYEWRVNGTVQTANGAELDGDAFAKGDVVEVSVTANDGTDDGTSDSASVTILNTPPTYERITLVSAEPVTEGSTLGCTLSGWADDDGDAESALITWYIDGVSVADGPAFTVSGASEGAEIWCAGTPFDGEESGPTLTSRAVTVGGGPVEECSEDPVLPTDPYVGRSIVPNRVFVSGSFAVDADTNTARQFCVDGERQRVAIDLLITDARFDSTNDLQYTCSVRLVPKSGTADLVENITETVATGGVPAQTLYGQGFILGVGDFEVVDNVYNASAGTVGSCLGRTLDPNVWSRDFKTLISAKPWGLFVGDLESQVEGLVSDSVNDDPADDGDLYSLHADGYLMGAQSTVGVERASNPYLTALAFEVDPSDWSVIEDIDGDPQRILGSDAAPTRDRLATGIYQVSPLGTWAANFVLE